MRCFLHRTLSLHKGGNSLLVLVICSLFSFVLYLPALDSYFVAEDLRAVNFTWSDLAAEGSSHGVSTGFRPGTVMYLVINNLLWERNQVGHHAVAFLLHGLVGWLTYLVARQTTHGETTAILAALFFVGAPVHSEAVIWLAAAANTVSSAFVSMLGVWLWINRQGSNVTVGVVAILYIMAMLIKETTIPLPMMFLLLDCVTGRFHKCNTWKTVICRLVPYWPFVVAFGLYAFLHWQAGVIGRTLRYGLHLGLDLEQLVKLWGMYARDLFRPLSDFLRWRIGLENWIWLGGGLLLCVVRRARWAVVWILLALTPGATTYGERLTYLAIVGFSMVIAASIVDSVRWVLDRVQNRILRTTFIGLVVLFLFSLLVADIRAVHRDATNWKEAGRLTWSIPRQARDLAPTVPSNAQLFFLDLPDNIGGAYAFRHGLMFEVRRVYGIPDLDVHRVVRGPDGPEKLSLSSIDCEALVPRFFFRYYPDSDKLRLVNPVEFGLDCPPN
jgi:hypothetical protein